MEKEFVPYELALELKELGFDEPCFGVFKNKQLFVGCQPDFMPTNTWCATSKFSDKSNISSPTFSQTFRWFRETHKLHSVIVTNLCSPVKDMWFMYQIGKEGEGDYFKKVANFKSYEEAELECLKKLIKLCKKN
jgi:hypothetical protein